MCLSVSGVECLVLNMLYLHFPDTSENGMTVEGLGIQPKSTINLVLQSRRVEVCEEKLADMTLRGRDWLEDRVSDDGR